MFYGWEDFKYGRLEVGEPLVRDAMESVADMRREIESLNGEARRKEGAIVKLQRELEAMATALAREQARHAEAMARNKELERELEERTLRERGLVKQLEDRGDEHDQEKAWYESEIQRLVWSLQTLEDAEERLVAQLGDLEAEAMEQSRLFSAEIGSLSQSLARKEEELSFSQFKLESISQRQASLKELKSMDLAAQLSKSNHELDETKLITESLQGEIERVRAEASSLRQELALAKLVSSWKQENKTIQGEKKRVPSQSCRSESLSLVTQRSKRHAAVAV